VGAQHSQCFEGFYAHIPGLKVVAPATAADAKGLLKSAIRDDNPVVFLEDERLYGIKGEVPEGEHLVPIGVSALVREGADCTIVTWGKMLHATLAASEALARDGVQCAVVDLRSLRPLDLGPALASVERTGRALVVHESWPYGGVGAEVVDGIQREAFGALRAPVMRVTGRDANMPYNKTLEDLVVPSADTVQRGVRALLAY
jgi:pyruvate dehydrogenase E1 component beta subunit